MTSPRSIAKELLASGSAPPDDLPDDAQGGIVRYIVRNTVDKCYGLSDQQYQSLVDLVRAAGALSEKYPKMARETLEQVCFFGPAETTDIIRRLVHEDKVEGWSGILTLSSDAQ